MAAIEARDIRKRFGGTPVLHGISLNVADGEFLTLVGPSGCGKTTLLRIIAGLEAQDSGTVTIGGRIVDEFAPNQRDVAMVFQSLALYPHLTVAENIAVPMTMRRLSTLARIPFGRALVPGARAIRRSIAADVAKVASTLEIEHLLQRKPGQLSGGERQRVAVARAIVRNPKAFLMDEPLSNLDAKLRVQMRTEIAQLHRRLGATFVYVTHDQAEAMTMSNRIAVMMDGELLQVGTPDQVYHEPDDLRVAEFVGSPKINVIETLVDESGRLHFNGTRLGINATGGRSDPINLAFRPETARLTDPGCGALTGAVSHTENLGADLFVHVRIDRARDPIIARLVADAPRVSVGDVVGIDIPPSRALAFGRSWKRIRLHPAEAETV